MKNLRNRHIPALIFWLVVILVTLVTMPDVSGIVRDKGALSLPKNEESQIAATIEKKANHNQKIRSFALVFSNGDKKLTATQKKRSPKRSRVSKIPKPLKLSTSLSHLTTPKPKSSLMPKMAPLRWRWLT